MVNLELVHMGVACGARQNLQNFSELPRLIFQGWFLEFGVWNLEFNQQVFFDVLDSEPLDGGG